MYGTVKTDDQIDKMYDTINEKYLINGVITRELMNEILNKMIDISYAYFDILHGDFNKAKTIYENNILCLRIANNKVNPEPTTINTVLSLLSGVYKFIEWRNYEKIPLKRLYGDSCFFNSINLCAVFEWNIKDLKPYQISCLKMNPPKKSHELWFINDGYLNCCINEFLNINIDDIKDELNRVRDT